MICFNLLAWLLFDALVPAQAVVQVLVPVSLPICDAWDL